MNRKSHYLAACGLLAMMLHGTAHAQTAPEDGAGTAGAISTNDIVVTANKREQRLNDVGVTAAVVGGDALQQQNLSSLADIAARVPSLSYASSASGIPVYTLRGVGFYELSIGAYPSVAIYSDEVPLPFSILAAHSTFDVERVEVLKGPQGTLFGQNATGGAINYIAAKPTDSFEAGATITYGRFNQLDGEAYVSGPLSETLKARLSGRIETADGWQISNSRPDDRNGKVRNYMGRLQLAFEPSESLRFLLNVNGWIDKSETQAGQHIALQFQNENASAYGFPNGSFRNPALVATPFSPLRPRAADWATDSWYLDHKVPFADNNMLQGSLRADLDVGDFGTLTSITAYTKFNMRQGADSDGLALHALDLPLTIGDIESFSQELRFANDPANPLRFVVGANYAKDKVYEQVNIDFDATSATIFGDMVFGLPLNVNTITGLQKMRNYAFFGNAEYDVADNVTLKAGVRYTNARDKANICASDPQAPYYIGNLFVLFSNLFTGAGRGPYQPGECYPLNADPEANPPAPAVDYLPLYAIGEYRDTLSEDNMSWRAGIDYKVTPDTLLYVNVSKGYKAGSYTNTGPSTLGQFFPAKQESVLAYEGGIKASLLDRSLQVNLAGFYYDYRDKQLRTKLNDPIFGQLDVLRNIPKSTVKGFELELTARPSQALTVNAAYTFLDATIDRFVGTNSGGDTGIDFAGTQIPYTPKHQIALSVNYDQPVSSRLNLVLGATVNHRSKTIATLGGDVNPTTVNGSAVACVYCIGDYTLVDAQIGIKDSDDRWKIFLWGKNIFNEYYWSNSASRYDSVVRFAGKPATYGVTLSYKLR